MIIIPSVIDMSVIVSCSCSQNNVYSSIGQIRSVRWLLGVLIYFQSSLATINILHSRILFVLSMTQIFSVLTFQLLLETLERVLFIVLFFFIID